MEEHYDVEAALIAQKEYCDEHNLPHFAPGDGICFKCRRQIYSEKGYSVERAGSGLITGCPFCLYSYCE